VSKAFAMACAKHLALPKKLSSLFKDPSVHHKQITIPLLMYYRQQELSSEDFIHLFNLHDSSLAAMRVITIIECRSVNEVNAYNDLMILEGAKRALEAKLLSIDYGRFALIPAISTEALIKAYTYKLEHGHMANVADHPFSAGREIKFIAVRRIFELIHYYIDRYSKVMQRIEQSTLATRTKHYNPHLDDTIMKYRDLLMAIFKSSKDVPDDTAAWTHYASQLNSIINCFIKLNDVLGAEMIIKANPTVTITVTINGQSHSTTSEHPQQAFTMEHLTNVILPTYSNVTYQQTAHGVLSKDKP
jgi:hypothetical protein